MQISEVADQVYQHASYTNFPRSLALEIISIVRKRQATKEDAPLLKDMG